MRNQAGRNIFLVTVVFLVGVVFLIYFMMGGEKITAFSSKGRIIILSFCSAVVTSCASLILSINRGEFPWWADALAIPIFTQELPLLIFLVGWALAHSLFVRGKFEG